MTREEIVNVLRYVAVCGGCDCPECESRHIGSGTCVLHKNEYFSAASYLIENQQRHIEALMKANDSLKDAIARRDKQIEDMNQGMAQLAKDVAVKEEQSELHAMKNELCQYCGKYKQAHDGACDGCKWREM